MYNAYSSMYTNQRSSVVKTMLAALLLCCSSLSFAQQQDISITVYTNNLALVKDLRALELPKGKSEVRVTDVASSIDPTSVHFKSLSNAGDIDLLEQNYEYDLVSSEKLLQKYIDQEITVYTKQDGPFQGKLLSASQDTIMLQMKAENIKIITFDPIINIDFPALPGGLITKPTLVWLVDNKKAGIHKTEVSYLTANINWHAEYVAVSKKSDGMLELNSWVSIDNQSGVGYENARLKLIAGEVHLASAPSDRPQAKGYAMMAEEAAPPQFEEKQFFEYHLYTLQRRATVKNNQIKQIALFPPVEIKVDKIYFYNGALYGDDVRVTLEFNNSRDSGLGIPLPKGKVRVYKEDEADNSLEFVGEDLIDHTPQDEKVRIFVGNAFDIKGERIQKEMNQLSDRMREETWQITLRNHKQEDVTVVVEENLWGDWKIRKESHPHKKKDATTIEFEIPVPADGEAVVEYTVLLRW